MTYGRHARTRNNLRTDVSCLHLHWSRFGVVAQPTTQTKKRVVVKKKQKKGPMSCLKDDQNKFEFNDFFPKLKSKYINILHMKRK
jgi:hypothetical protein